MTTDPAVLRAAFQAWFQDEYRGAKITWCEPNHARPHWMGHPAVEASWLAFAARDEGRIAGRAAVPLAPDKWATLEPDGDENLTVGCYPCDTCVGYRAYGQACAFCAPKVKRASDRAR